PARRAAGVVAASARTLAWADAGGTSLQLGRELPVSGNAGAAHARRRPVGLRSARGRSAHVRPRAAGRRGADPSGATTPTAGPSGSGQPRPPGVGGRRSVRPGLPSPSVGRPVPGWSPPVGAIGRPRPLASARPIETLVGALRLRGARRGSDGRPPEAPPRARRWDRQHVDRIGPVRSRAGRPARNGGAVATRAGPA